MAQKRAAQGSRKGVDAVDRALTILCTLAETSRPMTLAELARSTGMYKSTLLRLLASLDHKAFVVRRADQKYAIGPSGLRLGRAFEATNRLSECVYPVLEWLIGQGTESPSFHVRHDDETRLCLFRIDSKHSTLDRVREGDLLSLRRGAPGKILRIFAAGIPIEPSLPLTVPSFGERDPSCASVATPVFGASGELVGALSLSGPLERFSQAAVTKMSKPLLTAAERATLALGGEWPRRSGQKRK